MKRTVALFCILVAAGTVLARAQAAPSAYARKFSITAGGMGSVFQPDFTGDWKVVTTNIGGTTAYPLAETSNYPLIGIGTYVDIRFSHWVQIEGEGRWLRFNQYNPNGNPGGGINMAQYLAGPRVPVYHFRKSSIYAKALVGYGKMEMGLTPIPGQSNNVSGRFTDIAFGGGMDVKLTKHISLRAFDVEYQYWPSWFGSTLSPYGASAGIGYKIF
jgi:hypothetical protein